MDLLSSALESAASAVPEAVVTEQNVAVEAEKAKEAWLARLSSVVQTRQWLQGSAKTILEPSTPWRPWWPGLQQLLTIAGGTPELVLDFTSTEIVLEQLDMSEPEAIALRWMECINWLCERIISSATGVRDGLVSIAGFSSGSSAKMKSRVAR